MAKSDERAERDQLARDVASDALALLIEVRRLEDEIETLKATLDRWQTAVGMPLEEAERLAKEEKG